MKEMLSMLSLEHMALEGRERDGLTGSLEILTSAFPFSAVSQAAVELSVLGLQDLPVHIIPMVQHRNDLIEFNELRLL